jgi:hypothetical protein
LLPSRTLPEDGPEVPRCRTSRRQPGHRCQLLNNTLPRPLGLGRWHMTRGLCWRRGAITSPSRVFVFVFVRVDQALKDRQQFEDAREVLPVGGSRDREMAFIAAAVCPGDVKEESHAISPSARAWPVECFPHRTLIRTEAKDSQAWPTSGISLGFSLGRNPQVVPAADQGGELMTAVDAKFDEGVGEVILDCLWA